jgi:hypothetical protein
VSQVRVRVERQGELAELWIVYRWRDSTPPHAPLIRAKRIDDEVCPTVNAQGIAGVGHAQYYLADSPPAGAIITTARD